VSSLAVSRDGQLIAGGDNDGKLIVWHGDTGESLTQAIKAHSDYIYSLDFSPDGTVLATGSKDKTTKLWSTETWQMHGNPISCDGQVNCVRYSPSGELAMATYMHIEIWNPRTMECIAKLEVILSNSLVWMPDGTRLLSGDYFHIREWDTSTWQQIRDWTGHTSHINAIAINSTGTLVAAAWSDKHVRLWRRSDRQIIAMFKHSHRLLCVAFSTDSKHILSGGHDNKISEWAVPDDALLQNIPEVGTHSFQCRPLSSWPRIRYQKILQKNSRYTRYVSSCCFGVNNYLMWPLHVDPPC
jgi:WD40 repeat protein